MKILQVTPRYPPHTGGIETHVKEISERLVDRGHDVVVHTADAKDAVEQREVRNGVDIRRHRGLSPRGAFHLSPEIAIRIWKSDADVVHAHNYHSFPLFFAALGVRSERFVVTPHYHGGSASGFRDRLLSIYRPMGRWALSRAEFVVAVSEWERDRLREDLGVNADVIPNGVDEPRFRNAEPEIRERSYLLTVGRLEEYKGIHHAIEALVELPAYDLLIAGNGPYRDDLEKLAAEVGVRDRVKFLGYVDDERLPRLYAGADVLLQLSSFEAYGLTVAESLAAGTPSVVREAGALTDWMSRSGVVGVDRIDTEAIVSAVRSAATMSVDTEVQTWDEVTDEIERRYTQSIKS